MNAKIGVTFATAGLFFVVVVRLLFVWWDANPLLGAMIGMALGWAAGILLAPYEEEKGQFRRLSKAVAAFVSGYLVGKVDRIFDLLLEKTDKGARILEPVVQRPLWIALICFLVTTVVVFVARTYWQVEEDKKKRA